MNPTATSAPLTATTSSQPQNAIMEAEPKRAISMMQRMHEIIEKSEVVRSEKFSVDDDRNKEKAKKMVDKAFETKLSVYLNDSSIDETLLFANKRDGLGEREGALIRLENKAKRLTALDGNSYVFQTVSKMAEASNSLMLQFCADDINLIGLRYKQISNMTAAAKK